VVRHRDFGAPASQDEPVTFTIYGQTFRCVPSLQGRTLLDFIATSANEDGAASAGAVLKFFDVAITAADRDRFTELTTSEDTVVPLETLASIMEWLVEQYAGRPTEPSSPSEPGDMITGPMPVAVPSYPEPQPSSMS
jgi:hypothetical protein